MDKLHYIFGEIDSDESITKLAEVLNTTSEKGLIQIPQSLGSGIIKKIQLDTGITMRVWNFSLNKPITFKKQSHRYNKDEKYFHIGYLLNTDSLGLTNREFPKSMRIPHGMNIVFFSGDAEMDFDIDTGAGLHAIDISVSYTWLMQAFSDSDIDSQISSFIKELNERIYPTMFLESSSPAEYRVVTDIYTAAASNLKSHLHIKAEAFLLVAEFFRKISSRSSKEVLESKVLYYDKMMMAEKMLEENLEGIFPGVDVIAKKVALSESTLKRYFKTVFNRSMYEHYLEIKMEYAKRLMLEKHVTVNEVASILNYEKVSSFIETFKKHHGYSPGQLKRKSA
jgi:AraC-like DNA-binding protein